jgi:hypothetical protein
VKAAKYAPGEPGAAANADAVPGIKLQDASIYAEGGVYFR